MASDLTPSPQGLWLCPDCDLVVKAKSLAGREKACCPRCQRVLARSKPDQFTTVLALIITGLVLYIPANFLPILTMTLVGNQQSSSVWHSVTALWESHMQLIAGIIFLFTMLIPLARLILLLPVFSAMYSQQGKTTARSAMRLYVHLNEWSMLEIYLLGILVSVIKLGDMATIHMGFGLFCFAGLMVTSIIIKLNLNEAALWERLRFDHRH